MFKELKNLILMKVNGKDYDSSSHAGKFGSSGSHIDDTKRESEPNGYDSLQNVLNVHPDGGKNTDLDARTTMSDIQDWHTNATQEILGNPTVNLPSKNAHRDVDAELANKYFSNLERR